MADTITTATDVARLTRENEQASKFVIDYIQDLNNGALEHSGDTRQELNRRIAVASDKSRELETARQEQAYDSALLQAAASPGGDEAVHKSGDVMAGLFNKALWGLFTGDGSKIIFEPPKRVTETEQIRCENPIPYANQRGEKVFQSTVYGPDEVINPLFSPPPSRRPKLQDQFTLTTSTANAPLFIDFYRMILQQDLFEGSLLDPMCVTTIDVEHTGNIDVPHFGEPATSTSQTEGAEITGDDSAFGEVILYASQQGTDTALTNRFVRNVQVPEIVNGVWTSLLEGLRDRCNTLLTTGTGAPGANGQPHGIYTATAAQFTDNRNRVQLDPDSTNASKTNLDVFSEAFGLLDPTFHRSEKTKFMVNQRQAMTMLTRNPKSFETNSMYGYVNFMDRDNMKGTIFSHLGVPVMHNPWLDSGDGTANNKLFVLGDFKDFWVRRSRIEMFVSDHVEAKKDSTYLRLLMYLDSRVVKWSWDSNRVGPFVYGNAI